MVWIGLEKSIEKMEDFFFFRSRSFVFYLQIKRLKLLYVLFAASKKQLAGFISSLHGHVASLLRHMVGSVGMF
jgi:hypothetical protein